MRETRLYGSEGGVARKRHPYPYRNAPGPPAVPGGQRVRLQRGQRRFA